MLLQVVLLWCLFTWSVGTVVLDPSLYLSSRPPLTDTSDISSNPRSWLATASAKITNISTLDKQDQGLVKSKEKRNSKERRPIERAKLFWPSLRPSHYGVGAGNIQIPLTFSLSGVYGKYAPSTLGSGVIGSSYGIISKIGDSPVSVLAGSGYTNYGAYSNLRVYSGEHGPAWSGWGNGKWGHYGKG